MPGAPLESRWSPVERRSTSDSDEVGEPCARVATRVIELTGQTADNL
ncbi:hypothetical protein [Lentzea californiensis]|nr:hypothetical protein [Lentzea californiensis]